MLFLQLGLAVCGVLLMRKPVLRVGKQYAYPPFPFLIGLVLISQVVICFLYGVKVGFEAAQKAAQDGKPPPSVITLGSQHIWVDLAVPIASLCLCGVLLQIGLRDKLPENDEPEWKKKLKEKMRLEAEMDPPEYFREEPLELPTRPEPEKVPARGRKARGRKDGDDAEESAIDLQLYADTPESPPRELRRRRWRFRER